MNPIVGIVWIVAVVANGIFIVMMIYTLGTFPWGDPTPKKVHIEVVCREISEYRWGWKRTVEVECDN